MIGVQFAVPPLAVAAELAVIQSRGYLIVAVKDNRRPLGFRDRDGELVGFEVDIARRLAEELLGDPNAVVFETVSNRERVEAVLNGQVDMAIAGLTATDVRRRIVTFSTPYYLDGTAFLTRNPNIQNFRDVARYPIAMLNGSSGVASVRSRLPGAQLVSVSSYQEAQLFLEANPEATFAADATVLSGWIQEYPGYRILTPFLSAEALAIAMPKGLQHDPLHRRVNQIVTRWYEEGWLAERATYWGLPY